MAEASQEPGSREDLEMLQLERLQSTLNRAYRQVKFYRRHFDKLGLRPGDIQELTDLTRLPFTSRNDLSENYPYGLFAVPLRDIVRIHSSPGTTEKPVVVGYTSRDLQNWLEIMARLYTSAGLGREDIVQIVLAPGLSNWGRDLKAGAEHLGASVIPMSFLNFPKQLMIMRDYKTSVLVTTPSFALHLVQVMDKLGMMAADFNLKKALLIAEPLPPAVRQEIAAGLQVKIDTAYGITEVMGPGLAFSCSHQEGLHFSEDHFFPEIIDPQTSRSLPPGEVGELVITTLSTTAFPLLRFRSGDLASLLDKPCDCGSRLIRLGEIRGRCDQIFSVGGIKVHPNQISFLIQELLHGYCPRHSLSLAREEALQFLEISIEINEDLFSDEVKCLEAIGRRLRRHLRENLGIESKVSLVERIPE
jgi:phenylacetate-CoA ligase